MVSAQQALPHRAARFPRSARHWQDMGLTALTFIFMLPTIFIFFWMLSLSLKTQVEYTAYPPIFFPSRLYFENYSSILNDTFLKNTLNSIIIAGGCTIIGMLIGAPASYAIVRWKFNKVAVFVLGARMVPAISFLIPWFIMFRQVGLVGTHTALILSHLVVNLPIIVWMLMSFFEDIPSELEDSAMIDGCSPYGVFWRIALPLTRPGLVATAILSVIFSWNNFLFSVVLARSDTYTLPVAVFGMLTKDDLNWGPTAAAAFLITLPVLIMTLFMQKHIVSGLSFGAVKG